ncbi:sigma-54 interaction domain-containing protein [Salidesulfovibrio onnuriiensis]|uniref:sigma-54 interaction domain-containing protein n=1 Tax=Salidesulfovibrio onnuriiensis TaxID=2583823 RepID=UPI00165059D6|nr:sigma 54-interacting transcriptional regulator [Salidesulfovibrio onnuriiensis]
MSKKRKFKLLFKDRIGIVFDITKLIIAHRLNIVCMEVEQKNGYALVSIEIDFGDTDIGTQDLLKIFATLPGIEDQAELKRLPQERRERWFRTLFDGMSEGIVSVNAEGMVNTVNSVACRILNLPYEDLLNTHVSELSPKNNLLMECVQKKVPVSRRKTVVTSTGRVEFYGSAKPINNSQGEFVGAVLLMKDLKEVKAMVDAVLTPIDVNFDDFIGESRAITNLISFARKIAELDTIISITGESGTGKELFAKAIHFESGRTGPFIPINCAALPESLIESELFGYVDGAFTGAKKKGKPGLFEAARNGTIFLDEIGDMPLGPQAKILRVLQDGFVRRIGGVEEIPVNARVITATNKNLADMVEAGDFREDLFYRINVLTIQIPPLRERMADIPLLVGTFLKQFNQRLQKEEQTISQKALDKLYNYSWPGNVRELQNAIERASILSDSCEITAEALHLSAAPVCGTEQCPRSPVPKTDKPLKDMVGKFEMRILLDALNSTKSIRKAAKQLGLSHTALMRRIKKYQLRNEDNAIPWEPPVQQQSPW